MNDFVTVFFYAVCVKKSGLDCSLLLVIQLVRKYGGGTTIMREIKACLFCKRRDHCMNLATKGRNETSIYVITHVHMHPTITRPR